MFKIPRKVPTTMSRIVLVHWNADEAIERAQKLAGLGHKVTTLSNSKQENLQNVRNSPPELFVIDSSRIPSQGREIAGYFRRLKITRNARIIFVGGHEDHIAKTRKLLPDATFAHWSGIKNAIDKALRDVPKVPAVPGTMAGYSGTPLPKKLGIREASLVLLVNAPDRFERKLEPFPKGAEFTEDARRANVAVLFVKSQADLVRDFRPLAKKLAEKVAFWISWPKKASGVATDLNENFVREFGLGEGWVDYKICAIDETWSGLCFARRK